jgi:hypothetical protein
MAEQSRAEHSSASALPGNYKYFIVLPTMAMVGGTTCVAFAGAGVALRFGAAYAAVAVFGVPAATCCVMMPLGSGCGVVAGHLLRYLCPKCLPPPRGGGPVAVGV